MAATPVPTTVASLLAKVTEVTGNIAKHRAAMADVAAQAAQAHQQQAQSGGDKK